jgi:hypothetical protein
LPTTTTVPTRRNENESIPTLSRPVAARPSSTAEPSLVA